jgi:hypothetical protein
MSGECRCLNHQEPPGERLPRTARRWARAHIHYSHVARIRLDYFQELVGGSCLCHYVEPGIGEPTGDTFAERIESLGRATASTVPAQRSSG